MQLDFSRSWRIIDQAVPSGSFAAAELAAVLGRISGGLPLSGEGGEQEEDIIVLSCGGSEKSASPHGRGRSGYSWRAAPGRVELYGENAPALLRCVYDFLDALGVRWPEPGKEGERLPSGKLLDLSVPSRSSSRDATPTTLILGHGVFLEDWENRLVWAARVGYSSIFIHTSPEALALGAAPQSLYETLRPAIAAEAQRLGLSLELGGHALSSLLPRSLFKDEPSLFRECDGSRTPDRNFCASSATALGLVAESFARWAAAHPETAVFHAWPDDLPGGGWCSCPSCASLSPAAQSLKAAKAMALALASVRPEASLSFLAYHDTADVPAALRELEGELPPNLELLWAPRMRSWGHSLGDKDCAMNTASLEAFRRAAWAWRSRGGGSVTVFEYWEDALLFKGAVPPLVSVIEGDLAAYKGGEAADAVGILCTGGRLPLGPRPNVALLPRLAASGKDAPPAFGDWALAAYGSASTPMMDYWTELEAAWAVDLDIEEGETAVYMPELLTRIASDPPVDWGDPWQASAERLAAKRNRCEELFEHLRRAETALAAAGAVEDGMSEEQLRAVRGEAEEYAISGSVLELNCARLAAYHELAAGDPRAAADIANLALSASGAVRKSFARVRDPRARREMNLLIELCYDLRLRAIRRANARSGLRRLVDLWKTSLHAALASRSVARAYEPPASRVRREPLPLRAGGALAP